MVCWMHLCGVAFRQASIQGPRLFVYLFNLIIDLTIIDVDQLNQILGILGTPEDEVLSRIASERAENVCARVLVNVSSISEICRIFRQFLWPRYSLMRRQRRLIYWKSC